MEARYGDGRECGKHRHQDFRAGHGDHNWTVDSIRPWVLGCIEAFGVERSIFATNWPVDSLFSDYDTLIGAYTEIVADFSEDEKRDMFARNTEALMGFRTPTMPCGKGLVVRLRRL